MLFRSGAAIGVYNTLQSLGFFVGGLAGGWLMKFGGGQALYAAGAAVIALWFLLAWPMRLPEPRARR